MPRGGFGGGGFGRGGLGESPVIRGPGPRLGCFGGLFGPLEGRVIGFLPGRNVASRPQPDTFSREEDLRRREEDLRRREDAFRDRESERGSDE